MSDTPIYDQLKAEREGRGRYARGGWIKQATTKIRVRPEFITLDECGSVSRKPLLKNRKRR